MKQLHAKRLTFLAMLTAIVLVQEEVLTALPNIQLTFFLLFSYATVLPIGESLAVAFCHVTLDSLWMGALNPIYMMPMYLGYGILVVLGRLFRNSPLWLKSVTAGIGSLIYCWLFAAVQIVLYHIPAAAYMASDLPFEAVLLVSTVLPTWVLHRPIARLIAKAA